jgi:hypothetical protein
MRLEELAVVTKGQANHMRQVTENSKAVLRTTVTIFAKNNVKNGRLSLVF